MTGELFIDTAPGEGSTFRFTINVTAVETAHDADQSNQSNLSGTRVLIVDDNETNREILHYYLSEWGIEADAVADGPRGLELLRTAADQDEPFRRVSDQR